jgi:hypothetical protein
VADTCAFASQVSATADPNRKIKLQARGCEWAYFERTQQLPPRKNAANGPTSQVEID